MRLRRIRLGVSIVVGLLFVVVFLGSVEWSLSLSGGLLYFQFVPSVVEFLLAAGGAASLGFLLVLVLTLIFGRIYCSGLCPLGILQDILIFLFKKVGGKRVQHKYRKPRPWIRYSVLLATLLLAMPGSLVLLNLLDPYSLFGRIASHLVKPPVYLFNNLVVSALESFDIYRLRPQEIPPVPLSVLGVSLLFFVGLLLLSLFYGRMYCNLICPVGT
ncbi:MAG: 4Fe-4S binding protein, partial [Proteobacteria bacterium]|nr:4Fe-4S binding protein [Pseudomonadota bacterium]